MSWSIACFCFILALVVGCHFLKRHTLRWCFGVALTGLCFVGGWMGISWQLNQTNYDFPKEESVYRVQLNGKPEKKERSYLIRVTLKERKDSLQSYPLNNQAILYVEQDSSSIHLQGNEELLVFTRISPPRNRGNFDEFDYARYLLRKGISGTGYVPSGKWKPISDTLYRSSDDIITFCKDKAVTYREKILSLYRQLGFDGDELAVLSALTIGDKTELSESIRESYSVSGASHILALSGLHIGLLYALFFFILKPVTERWQAGRCFRSLILICLLWAFAFFTGLSSSVVRSVCMFSILAIADLFRQQTLSLNTLGATAFLMLLCNPVWLFDVGFQLSFLAVAAILLLQQPIYRLLSVRNRPGRYVWGLMSVSIAAQLGTAPLVLYYFSRFSTHFLLTNLVVIPLVTIILYSAVLMLFLTPVPAVQDITASIVHFLLKVLNGFIRWVEQLPYASMDGIRLTQIETLGLYLCLSGFLYYFISFHIAISGDYESYSPRKRNPGRILLTSTFLLFIFCAFHVARFWNNSPKNSIVFYNVGHCPVVHCITDNGSSWLVYGDSLSDKKQLYYAASNYWDRYHLQAPMELTSDYQSTSLRVVSHIISFNNTRICMINDNRWRDKTTMQPLSVNYLYMCRGYKGTINQLTQLFSFRCVVLDTSLPEYQKNIFRKECESLGFVYHSLSEEGALCFSL